MYTKSSKTASYDKKKKIETNETIIDVHLPGFSTFIPNHKENYNENVLSNAPSRSEILSEKVLRKNIGTRFLVKKSCPQTGKKTRIV